MVFWGEYVEVIVSESQNVIENSNVIFLYWENGLTELNPCLTQEVNVWNQWLGTSCLCILFDNGKVGTSNYHFGQSVWWVEPCSGEMRGVEREVDWLSSESLGAIWPYDWWKAIVQNYKPWFLLVTHKTTKTQSEHTGSAVSASILHPSGKATWLPRVFLSDLWMIPITPLGTHCFR